MVYSLFEKWTGIFQPALVCSTIRWMANLHETLTSTQWNAGESILMPLELHLLATRGEIEKLRLALDDDSSRTHIDAYDRLGMTPFMCAVQSHTHALFCRNPRFSSYCLQTKPRRQGNGSAQAQDPPYMRSRKRTRCSIKMTRHIVKGCVCRPVVTPSLQDRSPRFKRE